jgi:hypothetical protein
VLPPLALECFPGSGDGNVDILLGGLMDGADDGLVGRVDDLEGLALDTLDEFVVDEAVDYVSRPLLDNAGSALEQQKARRRDERDGSQKTSSGRPWGFPRTGQWAARTRPCAVS